MTGFFGINLKPMIKYSWKIPRPFHVSGVAMGRGDYAKVYVNSEEGTFILATLNNGRPQASLNLRFGCKEHVTFVVKGNATVSLTGMTIDDENENKAPAGHKEDDDEGCVQIKVEEDEDNEIGEISQFSKTNDEKYVEEPEAHVAKKKYSKKQKKEMQTLFEPPKADVPKQTSKAYAKKGDDPFSGVSYKQKLEEQTPKTLLEPSKDSFAKNNDLLFSVFAKKQIEGMQNQKNLFVPAKANVVKLLTKKEKKIMMNQETQLEPPKAKKLKKGLKNEKTVFEEVKYQPKEKNPNLKQKKRGAKRTITGDLKF